MIDAVTYFDVTRYITATFRGILSSFLFLDHICFTKTPVIVSVAALTLQNVNLLIKLYTRLQCLVPERSSYRNSNLGLTQLTKACILSIHTPISNYYARRIIQPWKSNKRPKVPLKKICKRCKKRSNKGRLNLEPMFQQLTRNRHGSNWNRHDQDKSTGPIVDCSLRNPSFNHCQPFEFLVFVWTSASLGARNSGDDEDGHPISYVQHSVSVLFYSFAMTRWR